MKQFGQGPTKLRVETVLHGFKDWVFPIMPQNVLLQSPPATFSSEPAEKPGYAAATDTPAEW